MDTLKSKSLKHIEEQMQDLDVNSLRYRILNSAKAFKTSWVDLGRCLYSAWKDKLYKDWGYNKFEIYTSREIGIRKETALKLLRSYYFLEKEEPQYLQEDYAEAKDTAGLPTYEAINVLRLAKNKKTLGKEDYLNLKKEIFQEGKDYQQARRDLTALIRQREELEPGQAWEKKKIATVKRFLSTLKSLKNEIETAKMLPASFIKDAASLIKKLEEQIPK